MEDTKQTENKEIKEIKYEKKSSIKTKMCKVLYYDKLKEILHLDFDGFGIQVNYKEQTIEGEVNIQYTSEIGKSDFTFKLAK